MSSYMVITMTKKNLVKLAAIVAATTSEAERKRLYEEIGGVCAEANPLFNWNIWRNACAVPMKLYGIK